MVIRREFEPPSKAPIVSVSKETLPSLLILMFATLLSYFINFPLFSEDECGMLPRDLL